MALGKFLEIELSEMYNKEIDFENFDGTIINYDGIKYQVLNEEQEEEEFIASLNEFIDYDILKIIPENLHNYYDREKHLSDLYRESERIGEEFNVCGKFYYVSEY